MSLRKRAKSKKTHDARSNVEPDSEEDALPTDEAWASMTAFSSFVVADAEEKEHTFMKNDLVAIVPHGRNPTDAIEPWQYWIGVIRGIRAEIHEDNTNSVWTNVQWYYDGKDVGGVIKSFDVKCASPFERVLANHFDFVSSQAIESSVRIIKFDERDPFQPFISSMSFFSRYDLERNGRALHPKPGSAACLCERPYNPNDSDPSALLHFCPRPSCRRAYHASCLEEAGMEYKPSVTWTTIPPPTSAPSSSIKVNPRPSGSPIKGHKSKTTSTKRKRPSTTCILSPRALGLLSSSPNSDKDISLGALTSRTSITSHQPPIKRTRSRTSNIPKDTPTSPEYLDLALVEQAKLDEMLSPLPHELLRIAQQPMVRGGAFAAGGVSGNVGFVSRARLLVYKILSEGDGATSLSDDGDDWRKIVFGSDFKSEGVGLGNAIVSMKDDTKKAELAAFLCPGCHGPI